MEILRFRALTGRCFLNVGGHSKNIPVPEHYKGWWHILLDIDNSKSPDIVCDARELHTLEPSFVDAVYCSHTLEHFYAHEVSSVLNGMKHVLKNDGFVEIIVPDLDAVIRYAVEKDMDIEDVLYESKAGPITVKDVIYGFGEEIKRRGMDYFAHKTGFTPKSLTRALIMCGFRKMYVYSGKRFEIRAIAFKNSPDSYYKELLCLPEDGDRHVFIEK